MRKKGCKNCEVDPKRPTDAELRELTSLLNKVDRDTDPPSFAEVGDYPDEEDRWDRED